MVRLLPDEFSLPASQFLSFNPTMVRLLLEVFYQKNLPPDAVSIPQWCDCCLLEKPYEQDECEFQSHNGAIAACQVHADRTVRSSFQSHNGAIAAISSTNSRSSAPKCFNPTMVRLLLLWCTLGCATIYWFQSHNGAIAALRGELTTRLSSFNPTMVRLLLLLEEGDSS